MQFITEQTNNRDRPQETPQGRKIKPTEGDKGVHSLTNNTQLYNTSRTRSKKMLNKSLALGLLAAGLMIAPTAAFASGASQSQNNVQNTEQNGAATNGSTNAQESNSINVQRQISSIKNHAHYGGYYHGNSHTSQDQNSIQGTTQNGAADNGSTNAQTSNTVNHQLQGAGIHH